LPSSDGTKLLSHRLTLYSLKFVQEDERMSKNPHEKEQKHEKEHKGRQENQPMSQTQKSGTTERKPTVRFDKGQKFTSDEDIIRRSA
jgi:hypothetical protein